MACATCGSASTSADGRCPLCDPWSVPAAQTTPSAAPTGLGAPARAYPRWLRRTLAKRYPPELIEDGLGRRPVVRYRILAFYLVMAAVFLCLAALVDPGDYRSLADWRYLGCSPLLLLVARAVAGRRRRRIGWFTAAVHHIRDNRPDLGFEWIVGMRQFKASRGLALVSVVLLLVLIDGNLLANPGSPGQARALFLLDAAGFALFSFVIWYHAAVFYQRLYHAITGRIARPVAPPSTSVDRPGP